MENAEPKVLALSSAALILDVFYGSFIPPKLVRLHSPEPRECTGKGVHRA
jgi:hypothetical protein